MNPSVVVRVGLTLIGLVALSKLALAPMPAAASPIALPTRPPTSTPITPTATPEPASLSGALIELSAPAAPATVWTVVQWQDGLGGWHTVEGWQGTFDNGTTKIWWVAPTDFNTGPFRWVVYDKPNGKVWGTSHSFNLPKFAGQHLVVDLSLK